MRADDTTRRWRRAASAVPAGRATMTGLAVAASLLMVGMAAVTASAQSATSIASVRITLNAVGPLPPGLTGYRIDALCSKVAGLALPGAQTLTVSLPVGGGTATLPIAVQTGTNCAFRLSALGTGPRPINGNGLFIGGSTRAVSFPVNVDGVPVEPLSVMESVTVPLEASTDVVFGSAVPVATSTTTTTPSTTTPSSTTRPPTTTTRPPTTTVAAPVVAVTLPPVTSPPVARPPGTARRGVVVRLTRDRRCRTGYRFTRGRCLTTAERKRYIA